MSGSMLALYSARTVENNFSAEWWSDIVFFNFDIIIDDTLAWTCIVISVGCAGGGRGREFYADVTMVCSQRATQEWLLEKC